MVLGVMLDPESIPLPAKLNTTEANTPSMLVVNPQAQSLLEVRRNIRRRLKRLSILLSICQDSLIYKVNQSKLTMRSFPNPFSSAVAHTHTLLIKASF
jgi:hypothetical protein